MKVIDVMSTEVLTIGPQEPLKAAARKMVDHGVSGLPVVDESGKLLGIITEADFLARETTRDHPRARRLLDAIFARPEDLVAEADTVGEVMTERVVTITRDATLAEAARVMTTNRVKRVPVVDAEGLLQGILSRADIMAAFTRPDEVIEDEIREDVIRRILLLDPDRFTVTVTDGVVALRGEAETRSQASLLQELAQRVEGVVAVESSLGWTVDDTKPDKWSAVPPGSPEPGPM